MEGLVPYAERELEGWWEDFEAFHARFAPLFKRQEPREQAAKYLRGLLAPLPRKNGWQLAEAVGDAVPDPTQRLLYHAQWDADGVRDEMQRFAIERFGNEEAIGVVDETGFLKQGDKSVGVKRQYTGTAGKTANCQVGVFLSYASRKGRVFLDRRLYLPEEWCQDKKRRTGAKVPEDVVFQTKPQLAASMLEGAWERGVPMRWVAGDEVYGNAPQLRARISAQGYWYVLAVQCLTPAWQERPPVEEPTPETGGRPRTKARLAKGASPPLPVVAVVAGWSDRQWQALTVAEGEKGPRTYEWAAVRVIEERGELPGEEVWLLARRSLSDTTDIAYYFSNAPADTPLLRLAQVASARFTVEECIKEAKSQAGLDDYEVRSWVSWHRHITLSLLAHTWLASLRALGEEKGGPASIRGRVDGAGSEAAAGDRTPATPSLERTASGMVPLATC